MNDADSILEVSQVRFAYRQRHSLFRVVDYPAVVDVSFDVKRGESIGIIGRNGCGKSTLLRLIAGIYRPDAGLIQRHCRRISLLSLALGFDLSLTGRENAVISGMLAGSTRQQVEAELDEILEFAELGDFVDEPIKTYSTGMRARLGFSVALKLRTELMLVDEVLSVGDAQFRQKAEKAMSDRISSEQSVLMVSHSLRQIANLCNRVLWLDRGRVREMGAPATVIRSYQRELGVDD